MLTRKLKFTLGLLAALAAFAACKPAKYEIVKPEATDPGTLVPTPGFTIEGPTQIPIGKPVTVTGKNCGTADAPGKITWVVVGNTAQKAEGPTATFTFDKAGKVTIEGTCEVAGKEPQKSTIDIDVTDPNAGGGGGAGDKFTIEGPKQGKVGEPVMVVGKNCGTAAAPGKITWIVLGNVSQKAEGASAKFTFDRPGIVTIQGTCELPGKSPQSGTIAIDILPGDGNGCGGQNGQNGQNPSCNGQNGQN